MKIAIGADHAGFVLKEKIKEKLVADGHQVEDVGTYGSESVDYPDFARQVAAKVASGEAERGILVCYTGVGMSIAANKVKGVRAALGVNPEEVQLTRRHNNANVLTLGAILTTPEAAAPLVEAFLKTEFEGGRHARRVQKITDLEQSVQ